MKPEHGKTEGFWHARLKSFRYAGRGLAELLRARGNARLHLFATFAVVMAGIVLRVAPSEWSALVLAMGLVWTAEAANTAIELIADRVSPERDDLIRRAKDMAAGAVLLAAISAAITGLIVLGPRAWALFHGQ